MAAEGWTHEDLLRKLREFEEELRDAGLKESTVRTYVDRSETFLKWLVGHCTPRGPAHPGSANVVLRQPVQFPKDSVARRSSAGA